MYTNTQTYDKLDVNYSLLSVCLFVLCLKFKPNPSIWGRYSMRHICHTQLSALLLGSLAASAAVAVKKVKVKVIV